MSEPSSSLTCPRCGAAVAPDATGCPRCGLTRDPDATRVRRPAGPTAVRTPTSPTAPAPRRPPPPFTPTPPLPRRPRPGPVVAGAAGLVLLLVLGLGTTLWLRGRDDGPGAAGAEESSAYVQDGVAERLPAPTDGPPEEAWTWQAAGEVSDVTLDGDGVTVSEPQAGGLTFTDPALVTRLDADGEEVWTVEFDRAAVYETQVGDDLALGTVFDDVSVLEMVSTATGESLWTAEGEYLGDDGTRVVVRREAGGGRFDLVALDARTGEEEWAVEAVGNATYDDGTPVTVRRGGSVRAHDATTGEVRWEVESPVDVVLPDVDDILGSATRSTARTGDQVVVVGRDGTAGLAADDGRVLWLDDGVRGGRATTVTPLLDGRAVIGASADQDGPARGAVVVDLSGPVGRPVPTPRLFGGSAAWDVDGVTVTTLGTIVVDDDLERLGRSQPVVLPVEGGWYGARPGRVELVDPASPDDPVWSAEIPGVLGRDTALGAGDGFLLGVRGGSLVAYR